MLDVVLVVHGGAGRRRREDASSDADDAVRAGLRDALSTGYAILSAGGSALDAVEQSVRRMEANEVFNAGRGSVLNAEREARMDASIMNGADRRAGAVAALSAVRHPISAARRVMEETNHVLLVGDQAVAFCRAQGLSMEAAAYFVTDLRMRQLERAKRERKTTLDLDDGDSTGTVGAVALDARGDLAAATSTGGMTNQLPGRVGDSAIIGAGTWAANATCAVSATGIGETIMRAGFARHVDSLIRYKHMQLPTACQRAVDDVISLRGAVGCVAVDRHGRVAMPFSTSFMARGIVRSGVDAQVALDRTERLSGTE